MGFGGYCLEVQYQPESGQKTCRNLIQKLVLNPQHDRIPQKRTPPKTRGFLISFLHYPIEGQSRSYPTWILAYSFPAASCEDAPSGVLYNKSPDRPTDRPATTKPQSSEYGKNGRVDHNAKQQLPQKPPTPGGSFQKQRGHFRNDALK